MPAIAVVALSLALTVPAMPQSPRQLLTMLMRADNAGDLEAVMAVYADDAVLLPPNEAAVCGKEAIRGRYARMFANTRMEVRFEVDDDRVVGNLGVLHGHTIGRQVSNDGRGALAIDGKWIMVLTRKRAGWVISALIWNQDR